MSVVITTNTDFDYWNINNLTRKQRKERNVGEYFDETNITPRQKFGMDLTKDQIRRIYDHGKFAESYISGDRMRLLNYDSHYRTQGNPATSDVQDADYFIEQFMADTYAIYGESNREQEVEHKNTGKSKLFSLRDKLDSQDRLEDVKLLAY